MRRTLIVLSLVLTFLAAGPAAAVEIDGLPTMEWGTEAASIVDVEDGEWIGPERMPRDVRRWFSEREVLGEDAEVSLLFYQERLIGWHVVFDLDEVADADPAQGLYGRLYEAIASRMNSRPEDVRERDDEAAFAVSTWVEPEVELSLRMAAADGFQRVEMSAARLRSRGDVRDASVHLFMSAVETEAWFPPRDWSLSQEEVIDDDPRWEPGFLNHEGVTSFQTVRHVLGQPALTMVVFVDGRLAVSVSSLTVHGGEAAKDDAIRELRRDFEAEYGEPTSENEDGVFWDTEQARYGVMRIDGAVGLGGRAHQTNDDVEWAMRMVTIGVAAPGMPRPAKGE